MKPTIRHVGDVIREDLALAGCGPMVLRRMCGCRFLLLFHTGHISPNVLKTVSKFRAQTAGVCGPDVVWTDRWSDVPGPFIALSLNDEAQRQIPPDPMWTAQSEGSHE